MLKVTLILIVSYTVKYLTSVPKLIICSLLKLKTRLCFYKHGLNPFIPLCQLRREFYIGHVFFVFFYWNGAVQLL